MNDAVATDGLTRRFGDFTAVDNLSLHVKRGTFFGFLGPNGAGKSTTIAMLTGLIRITAGKAKILGYDMDEEPVEIKRRIGVVPEGSTLFERLTAREYLSFVGRMYGMKLDVIAARSKELLDLMELDGDPKKLIVDFSHGMKKKLAISAAIIHEPQLLFLDEPFEGVDAVSSRLIKTILASLIKNGVTIFLTSHILEIVEKLCDGIAIINNGHLVAQGTLEELQSGVIPEDCSGEEKTRTLEEIFLQIVNAGEMESQHLSWLE